MRQNYSSINFIKVRWDYQKANKSKLTQCYNCQMFGHGSSRCKVKTFCAKCAGNHKTTECNSTVFKCANCNGAHKAMSPDCPSRANYVEIRQRVQPKRIPRPVIKNQNSNTNYNTNFPNSLHQKATPTVNSWGNTQTENQNNNLFSFEELKNLTVELISNLSKCKSRADQFEVITSLACKFLYR